MTLLNGLLAFGAAAFTIPLIIHLLHRNRYQTVDWGAMHLLQSVSHQNSKQIQWQQLLLLVLRCALPVLLALSMARPLLQSFLAADGRSPMSIAIVMDDSMSMFTTDPNAKPSQSQTRFSMACQSAVDLLNDLPEGSNAIITLGGSAPETLSSQVPGELAKRLSDIGSRTVPAGDFSLDASIRSSLSWLANSPLPKRQLVLISDFQEHEWGQWKDAGPSELSQWVARQNMRPAITFLRVGSKQDANEVSPSPNLAAESIDFSTSLLTVGRELSISISIRNHGDARCDSVPVAIFANEVEVDRQEVAVEKASTTFLQSRWTPSQTGDQRLRVQILRDDDLMADNSLSAIAIVQEPIPILLVDGDARTETMRSETDFLRLALSPFALLAGEKGDAFSSRTVQPNELNEAMLSDFRTICLCNVREVSETQQRWLKAFVEKGNGLIVFLGDKVQVEQYQSWPTIANNGLRIANFSKRTALAMQRSPETEAKSNDSEPDSMVGDRIKMQQIEFSPIQAMSSASLNSLASVRFEHRTPMALDSDAMTQASDASVAMRFEDNQAWIIESRIGKGRCLWISTACDNGDSNLPTRSVFVPLVQKLLTYTSNAEPPRVSLLAGEEWTRKIPQPESSVESLVKQIYITKPDGSVAETSLADDSKMRFSDTRLLGTYLAKPAKESLSSVALFADVRSNDARSNNASTPECLSSEALAKLAVTCGATVSGDAKEFLIASHSDWHGREIWTWIWTALVVCFLAEMATEQRLAPRLRTKSSNAFGRIENGPAA